MGTRFLVVTAANGVESSAEVNDVNAVDLVRVFKAVGQNPRVVARDKVLCLDEEDRVVEAKRDYDVLQKDGPIAYIVSAEEASEQMSQPWRDVRMVLLSTSLAEACGSETGEPCTAGRLIDQIKKRPGVPFGWFGGVSPCSKGEHDGAACTFCSFRDRAGAAREIQRALYNP